MRNPLRFNRPSNAWQDIVTNLMLWIALLVGVAFVPLLIFTQEATGYIILPAMYVSGAFTFLLPLGFLLAIARRTRAAGGVIVYVTGSLWIIYLWLFALTSLYQNTWKGWGLIGVIASVFSRGLGMFAVFALVTIMAGQWAAAGMIVGGAIICRLASHVGKYFMGLVRSENDRRAWVLKEKSSTREAQLDATTKELSC